MEEKYMKKYYVAIFLIFAASTSFAFDSDRCKLVSEATWERFGYKTKVICTSHQIDIEILDTPSVRDITDLGRFFGYINGWGLALRNQHDMEYETKLVITIGNKSFETTVGDCIIAEETGNYKEFAEGLIKSYK